MISSPNRHSPIGIAARRFGGLLFSGGFDGDDVYVYCRRVQSLHSFICGVGPSGFEKLKNETSEFSVQKHIRIWTCPPSQYTIVCGRAGGAAAWLDTARRCRTASAFASTGGGAPSDPARDDTSETGRGWFGVGHAMPMVHGTIGHAHGASRRGTLSALRLIRYSKATVPKRSRSRTTSRDVEIESRSSGELA
jgi:hypothetical protein